jgi:peptidoglycan/LPS O-acetylase OafA/YrhL
MTDELIPAQAGTPAATVPSDTAQDAPPQGRTRRLPTLTGLRFVAAALVFLFHSSLASTGIRLLAVGTVQSRYTSLMVYAGGFGVGFFFVLSGFILTWSAPVRDTAGTFWRRRFFKIVPAYLVAWVLAVVLLGWSSSTMGQKLLTFFMLQAWVPDLATNYSVDPPSWSLSTEAFFYLAFPLILPLAKRILPQHLKYWIGGAMITVLALPLLMYAIVPAGSARVPNVPTASANYEWFAYIFPPTRLLDFVLGVLVARAVMAGRWRDIGMLWPGVLLVACYAISFRMPLQYGLSINCVIPAALLVAAGARADVQGRFTLFRNKAMVWLGEISYAFYLVQYIVLEYGRTLLGGRFFGVSAGFALIAAEGLAAVALAWVIYACVERPAMRRWSRPRRAAPR